MSLCKFNFLKKCKKRICDSCDMSPAYRQGLIKGRENGICDVVNLIISMQESAAANMMWEREDACERILNAIGDELIDK